MQRGWAGWRRLTRSPTPSARGPAPSRGPEPGPCTGRGSEPACAQLSVWELCVKPMQEKSLDAVVSLALSMWKLQSPRTMNLGGQQHQTKEGGGPSVALRHTTVLPFILIEMRTTHHQYPSRSCGLAAVCTFSVGYILWVCWIHQVTGVWVYPLLDYISPGAKIIFFVTVTLVLNIFYLLGEVLNNYIWDTQKCIEEGKEKPKMD
ncbi:androgen-induced gene 1 protein isoform X2 [Caretta caretta]|uniref:androgen-induced gene 1 protein isoform X2 n=1 Tax=Caretta caretta TaxID=8467 RepID=UPI003F4B7779